MAKRVASSDLTRDNWDCEDASEEMGIFKKASPNELKMRTMRKGKRRGLARESLGPSVFQDFTAFGSTKPTATPSFSFIAPSPNLNFGNSIKCNENGGNNNLDSTKKNSLDPSNFSSSMFSFVPSSNQAKPKGAIPFSPELQKDNEKNSTLSPIFSFGKTNSDISSDKSKMNSDLNKNKGLFSFGLSEKSQENSIRSPKKIDSSIKVNPIVGSEKQDTFLNSLKSLNMNLLDWLKQHLDKNSYIDLTPIFEDYKNHLDKMKCNRDSISPKPNLFDSQISSSLKKDSAMTFSGASKSSNETVPSFSFGLKSNSNTEKVENSTKPTSISGFQFSDNPLLATSTSSVTNVSSSKGFSFGSLSDKPSLFQFGSSNGSSNQTENKSASISFSTEEVTSSNLNMESASSTTTTESSSIATEEEPYKVNEVKEDNAIYEQKVKLFYKKDGNYVDKGVGTLFLKLAGNKTQLIVRALTNLGTILLNIVLNDSLPTQRVGKNNVMIVCVPNPAVDPSKPTVPVSMLIRVKTAEDADKLLEKIDELKKK